mgnify:CR=1 FL=1
MSAPTSSVRPWAWIPTLYFAQGVPYVVVMTLSTVVYKNLGVSNTDIALYTSWLYLPWVIKPLWSPLVDMFGTKRRWIVTLQFVVGVALALVALTLPGPEFFRLSLAVFWLMAFSSATHDIAADGFYLLAMPAGQQSAFVGVRSTFYRLATLSAQGGLVYLAGRWQESTGSVTQSWALVFGVFAGFLRKPGILTVLAFLLLYRLGEAQALKLLSPFLLDARDKGGLGLSTREVGIVYGTVGIAALTLGGLLGGWAISRRGLKAMLWPMILATHAPIAVFLLLALHQPSNLWLIGAGLAVEQFGYGFGFTAYMLYMMLVAEGPHKTAHYAICTGFMALGMMLPGMAAGWIEDQVGYVKFFAWVLLCTVPSFIVVARLRIDPAFGRKQAD